MFGFLKNLIRKPAATQAEYEEMPAPEAAPAYSPPPAPAYPGAVPRPNLVHQHQTSYHQNGKGVQLPLQKILAELPLELQSLVLQPDVGEMTISVPLEKVLAQLSRGNVKISFGELRHAAPGVFSADPERDRVLVSLPLSDILAQLNPALITRRRAQRKVEVPEDISSPFDAYGQGLVLGTSSTTTPQPAPAPAPVPAPAPRQITPAAPKPMAPARGSITFAPKPTPPTAMPPAAKPSGPIPFGPPPAAPKPPAASRPSMPTPAPTPAPPAASRPNKPSPTRVPPAVSRPSMPAPAAAAPTPAPNPLKMSSHPPAAPASVPQPAKPAGGPEPLMVSLTALAEGWPEAVRKEIVDLKLVDARVALPHEEVERALKLGRIAFSWKNLRSWARPAPLPTVSAHDGMVLELPLKVVAPLFLARQREANKAQHKVVIDEEIPNLFFGFPQGESAAAAVASPGRGSASPPRPEDTNYYVWDDSSDVVRERDLEEQRHPSAGTRFVAKYATPNEIVSRAAALDGVVGAIIALPDGLMVANQLPPDLNGDTLAAFLPQIFGKVSTCTKELRMGDLNNLNFTVGNVPWKIFRVNAIFFAAFGRTGEPLPTGQLAALAAELDHKPK